MKLYIKLYLSAGALFLFLFILPVLLKSFFSEIPGAVVGIFMFVGIYGGIVLVIAGNIVKKKFGAYPAHKPPKLHEIFPIHVRFFFLSSLCFAFLGIIVKLQELYESGIWRLLGGGCIIGTVGFLITGIVMTLWKLKDSHKREYVKFYITAGACFSLIIPAILLLTFGDRFSILQMIGMLLSELCVFVGFFFLILGSVVAERVKKDPNYQSPKFYRVFPAYGNLFSISGFLIVCSLMLFAFFKSRVLPALLYFGSFACLIAGFVLRIQTKKKQNGLEVLNSVLTAMHLTAKQNPALCCKICGCKFFSPSNAVLLDEQFYCKKCFRERFP